MIKNEKKINVLRIAIEHPYYQQERVLRNEILLRPIGLPDHAWEMKDEEAWHFVAVYDNQVVGCAILVPTSDTDVQLMQMAVATDFQSQGIGKLIVLEMIQFAKQKSIHQITCHARDTAIKFYERLGFEIYGEPFEEVGILHRHMKLRLSRFNWQ